MIKAHVVFVYIILCLFSVLAIRGWYGTYTEFLSEQAIANGIVSTLFTIISVLGWVFRKDIINDVIK